MYDNMHRVQNQEILKLSPDSKLVIDEHGKATLRVRIEEVSKNHQKQVRHATGRDGTLPHMRHAQTQSQKEVTAVIHTHPTPTLRGGRELQREKTNKFRSNNIHTCMHA